VLSISFSRFNIKYRKQSKQPKLAKISGTGILKVKRHDTVFFKGFVSDVSK
jgi:hypothetical protein